MKRRTIPDLRSEFGRKHEEGLVHFVEPGHRQRFMEILKKVAAGRPPGSSAGGGRYEINHFPWWNYELAEKAPPNRERVESRLRELGAPDTCWVVCQAKENDAIELPLSDAIGRVWESGYEAAVVSCVPGRLAYYHDEDEMDYLILRRN